MVVGREVELYTDWADPAPGRSRYGAGSGYLLAGRLVLTAAHVACPAGGIDPGVRVRVRAPDGPGLFTATVVWRHPDPGVDVAVVQVSDPAWAVPGWRHRVRFGRLVTTRARQPCEATGFPNVVATPQVRDRYTADGLLHPKALGKTGRLAVEVSNPPAAATPHNTTTPDTTTWWAGMSGAAVLAGGSVVGVVTTDPRGFDSRRLVAVPITTCTPDPAFAALLAAHGGAAVTVEAVELAGMAEPVDPPDSPAGLLRADTADTPFRARPELTQLQAWCADEAWWSVRLVVGPGGQGKTRLARHLAAGLAPQGWATLILADTATAEELAVLGEVAVPTLVVVDYAETRATQLDALIAALRDAPEKTRLLLLARTAGEWRTERVGPSPALRVLAEDRIVVELGPVDPDPLGRAQAWQEAVTALAPRLAGLDGYRDTAWTALAATLPPPVLPGPRYRTILAVQMHALATLLDTGHPTTSGSSGVSGGGGVGVGPQASGRAVGTGGGGGGGEASGVLLRHESGYWTRVADRFGITLAPVTRHALVAATTLWGAATPADADRVLAAVLPDTDRDTRAHTADWLATLYRDGDRHWAGLQPDRLGEDLIATALSPGGRCPTLIADTIAAVSPGQLDQGLTVLGRAAPWHPHLGEAIAAAVLGAGAAGGRAAITVAARLDSPQPVLAALARLITTADLAVLNALDAAMPRFSLLLSPTAVILAGALVEQHRTAVASDRDAYLPDLAGSVNNLALRLGEAGRRADGLTAAQEAVTLYRELAALNRDAYLPDLAMSVNNLAIDLAEAGRRADGLTAAQEAVTLYRELVELNRDAYLPDLAGSVNNLAIRLGEAGRRADGLAAAQEAVTLRRELAELNRDAYLPALAMSVNNLAIDLAEAGRRADGLTAAQEAVTLRRELAELNRDAYLPDLAASVNNLALRLGEAGRRADGLTAAQEAVTLRRELAELNRDAYLPNLATSVNNLALRLGEAGRRADGLTAAQEASTLYHELTDAEPEIFAAAANDADRLVIELNDDTS